ncbi:phosphoethanolamine transferase [Psychromonas aquimarina]|uniref:phosphoethanolamine transferase n=1 Tax=Psychromonas aquimarina TaxID=444919 RepID=UPI00048F4360|nr:phosphoethanolamine--lipid A transferase [Psychromonas aquimarina]
MNKIKSLINKEYSPTSLVFAAALYFTFVLNFPLLEKILSILTELQPFNITFALSITFFLLAALNFIFNLFNWPYIIKPFLAVLITLSSVLNYAMYHYGVIFDQSMIENVFETDPSEAGSYFSIASLAWVLALGIIPSFLILKVKLKTYPSLLKALLSKVITLVSSFAVISAVLFIFYKDFSSVGRNNMYLRNMIIPTYFVYSLEKHTRLTYFTAPVEYEQIGLDAKQVVPATDNGKPTLFVFLLGETARSANYELNGYPRETNKYTKKNNVLSFQDVSSCGTSTAVSVPCMYSVMDRLDYSKQTAVNQDNFMDIMQRAGVSLYWKENDGGDKGAALRIPNMTVDRSQVNEFCDGKTCHDMSLLENFESEVDAMQGNKFITLHLIGSHGPTYYKRYPQEFQTFMPDCRKSDIENCTTEEIVNTYDNSILYTDYVINEMIKKLQAYSEQYNTALFYVSDHGESLGENGLYLHGTPYSLAPDYQTKVPMMIWFSEGFKEAKGIDSLCLAEQAQTQSFSHDNIFHSMLGIMGISTEVYNQEQDIFHSCRQ